MLFNILFKKKRLKTATAQNYTAEFTRGKPRPDSADHFYFTDDTSLLHSTTLGGDVSVYLDGLPRFEIVVDSATGICVYIQAYLNQLRVKSTDLRIPDFRKNYLIFSSDDLSTSYYLSKADQFFIDLKRHILCFGNPEAVGKSTEFCDKAVAITNNGDLECIYMNLEDVFNEPEAWERLVNCLVID